MGSETATATQGDIVQVHFTGRVAEGGEVFGSSEGQDPLEFTVGAEQVIPGIDEAVVGMTVGESKTVTIAPQEGFGEHRGDLLMEVPQDALPDGVKVGDRLATGSGEERAYFQVVGITEEKATLDGNHPLAGQTLECTIEVVSVRPSG